MLTSLALISILSSPADALSVCSLNHDIESLRQVYQKASVPKKLALDPRYGLHEGADIYGIKPDEVEQLKGITLKVGCPRTKSEEGSLANGFLIGENAPGVLTNAHVVKDEDGNYILRDMSTCFFATSANPNERIPLRLDNEHAKFGTNRWAANLHRDFVMTKTGRQMPGAKPLPFSARAAELQPGEKVFMISQVMERMPKERTVLPGEPVIQQCEVIGYQDKGYGKMLQTTCADTERTSGSMIFIRNPATQGLETVAMHAGGGPEAQDGEPIDVNTGNYSDAIAVDGPLKNGLEQFLNTKIATGSL